MMMMMMMMQVKIKKKTRGLCRNKHSSAQCNAQRATPEAKLASPCSRRWALAQKKRGGGGGLIKNAKPDNTNQRMCIELGF